MHENTSRTLSSCHRPDEDWRQERRFASNPLTLQCWEPCRQEPVPQQLHPENFCPLVLCVGGGGSLPAADLHPPGSPLPNRVALQHSGSPAPTRVPSAQQGHPAALRVTCTCQGPLRPTGSPCSTRGHLHPPPGSPPTDPVIPHLIGSPHF